MVRKLIFKTQKALLKPTSLKPTHTKFWSPFSSSDYGAKDMPCSARHILTSLGPPKSIASSK